LALRFKSINHLRATDFHIALLINFGTPKIEIKRIVNPHYKTASN
jgi:hypothetical protein